MSTSPETAPANNENRNGKRRKVLLTLAAVFMILGGAWTLYWLLVLSKRERTDDAYVSGDQVFVSTQVPGTVVAVLASATDLVQAGQVLVRLDRTDATTHLQEAASALAQAVRQFRQAEAQAAQLDAAAENRRLELKRAEIDLAQREPLLAEQAIAAEELRHARASVELAKAALSQAERQAAAAHALIAGTDASDNPAVLQARSAYLDAWIAAQRDSVLAPVTGHVAERNVQIGQHVQPGQNLMAVIPLNNLWVDANFKEVQLRNLRIGQRAEVRSDVYGGAWTFHGRVIGIGAGTGAAFSLLPAQNASGNWIKVVQRVPVRIELDSKELEQHPLRIGLSTTVTVDTTDHSGAMLATTAVKSQVVDSPVYSGGLAEANAQADLIIEKNMSAR